MVRSEGRALRLYEAEVLRTPRSQFRSQPVRNTGRSTSTLVNDTKNRVVVTKINVAGGETAERWVALRYRRSMNLDQVELLITVLSLLLAVASLYLVVKRGGWELPGSA